ncbi:L-glutamate gamma-semialdehyde dehydrogenase [Priestia megaterium]
MNINEIKQYKHEPFTDFTIAENKDAFESALELVQSELGKDYPLVIGGELITTEDQIQSINPANKAEIIGRVSKADQDLAEKAMQAALSTFNTWKKEAPEARADILFRAADIIRRRKHEFSAYLVKEAGKPWKEADADTAEAIDFLEYYARQMVQLKDGAPVESREGEENKFNYIPLGVGVIISPFNFPLAIMAGTAAAAIVAGNTVLLKPANNTPVIAAKFVEVMKEAGLPDGVLNYVPGSGSEIGDYLVDHPKTRFVSFTGSREVGCRIYERAAKVQPGQIWLKRVIAEMGGKDTVVVDKDADLEKAASLISQKSFNNAGQVCISVQRIYVHTNIYTAFVNKLKEKTEKLVVGNPMDEQTDIGPMIRLKEAERVEEWVKEAVEEGAKIELGGKRDGAFYLPTILTNVNDDMKVCRQEVFGPVVAIAQYDEIDEVISKVNDSDYGLQAGLFTNDLQFAMKAAREIEVGGLIVNDASAYRVDHMPYGGVKKSGNGKEGPKYAIEEMTEERIIVLNL